MKIPSRYVLGISALTILALLLRLINLNSGLWVDEMISMVQSFRSPVGALVTTFPSDNHHPLYSLLARGSLLVFGEHAWSVRLPAALLGAGSIPALFLLGRKIGPPREALWAAALLTVSYHHVWFSQNARGYTAMTFFAVIATTLLISLLDRPRPGLALGYGIIAGLGMYTHLTMGFVIAGHALLTGYVLLRHRGGWRMFLLAFGMAGVVTVALYAPMISSVLQYFLHHPSRMQAVATAGWAIGEALRSLSQAFGAGWPLLGSVILAGGAGAFLLGCADYARNQPRILALFLAPVPVIIAGAVLARGTVYPRFLFSLIGFGLLLVVRGTFTAARRLAPDGSAGWVAQSFLSLALLSSLGSLLANYRYPKQDFDGALSYVEAHRKSEESVVTAGVAAWSYREYFHRDWPEVSDSMALLAYRRRSPVWLVYTFPQILRAQQPEIAAVTARDCAQSVRFPGTIGGGDLYACRLERMR